MCWIVNVHIVVFSTCRLLNKRFVNPHSFKFYVVLTLNEALWILTIRNSLSIDDEMVWDRNASFLQQLQNARCHPTLLFPEFDPPIYELQILVQPGRLVHRILHAAT